MKKFVLVLVLTLSIAVTASAQSPAPVSWWEFEEITGTVAGDTMGLNPGNLDLMDFSTNVVAGRDAGKQALNFSANADVLRVPTSASLQAYDAMSFMCWVNLASAQQLQVYVSTESAPTWGSGFSLLGYPGTQTAAYAFDGTTAGSTGITDPTSLPVDEWHMLTYTHNGVDTASIYVDDTPVVSGGQLHSPSTGEWLIGESFWYGVRPMIGAMDEAAYWDVELTPDDVIDVYNNGVVPEPMTLSLLGLGGLALLRRRR